TPVGPRGARPLSSPAPARARRAPCRGFGALGRRALRRAALPRAGAIASGLAAMPKRASYRPPLLAFIRPRSHLLRPRLRPLRAVHLPVFAMQTPGAAVLRAASFVVHRCPPLDLIKRSARSYIHVENC